VGGRAGDAVGELVARFNREGLAAVEPRHGGGPRVKSGAAERERILAEVRRTPDRERDQTATWSLTTLQRALRTAERVGQRNGYREREWDTRVGTIGLRVPRVRDGSHFPTLLEPRRRAEQALVAVVREAYV